MPEKFEQIKPILPTEQTNQEKIDLSQFGLEKNSWLEKTLNGQNKKENENVISAISEQTASIFGPSSQEILRVIFRALNDHWVSKCQNPKDFRKYAETIID